MQQMRTPAKRKGGNPAFVASLDQRKLVMVLTASGHVQRLVAARLNISIDTLQRHFRDELTEGKDWANSSVGEVLFREALKGDVKAIAEWFDRRGGSDWRKRTASEQSGPGGGPIRISAEPARRDLSTLTEDELELFEKMTARIERLESNDRASN